MINELRIIDIISSQEYSTFIPIYLYFPTTKKPLPAMSQSGMATKGFLRGKPLKREREGRSPRKSNNPRLVLRLFQEQAVSRHYHQQIQRRTDRKIQRKT